MPMEDLLRFRHIKGPSTRQGVEHDHTQRIKIGAVINKMTLGQDLRGHGGQRPTLSLGKTCPFGRQTKIDQLDPGASMVLPHQNIGGLDVKMDHALMMDVVQGHEDLDKDLFNIGHRFGLRRLKEVLSPTVFRGKKRPPLCRLTTKIIDTGKIGMAEFGQEAKFTLKLIEVRRL